MVPWLISLPDGGQFFFLSDGGKYLAELAAPPIFSFFSSTAGHVGSIPIQSVRASPRYHPNGHRVSKYVHTDKNMGKSAPSRATQTDKLFAPDLFMSQI
jgi:hypothetical protein